MSSIVHTGVLMYHESMIPVIANVATVNGPALMGTILIFHL